MSIESFPQQPFEPKKGPQKLESIFDHYSIPNEILFIRDVKKDGVPADDVRYYISENVYRFLGEYAGRIPYSTVSLTLGENDIEYAGISVSPSYENNALVANPGSREKDDWIGWEKIRDSFLQGEGNQVWISPPLGENEYGFVYFFRKDPEDETKIKEYILEYSEEPNSLEKSNQILRKLNPGPAFDTASQFLHNPVESQLGLAGVLQALDISNENIASSLQFEDRVRLELRPWVEDYIDAVFDGRVEDAERSLTAIYNRASDIKKIIDDEPGYVEVETPDRVIQAGFANTGIFDYYASHEAKTAGGKCPVSRSRWKDPLSPYDLYQSLKSDLSPNSLLNENSFFVCPSCKFEASGPVGDECPNCHLTKEEHARQGGVVC